MDQSAVPLLEALTDYHARDRYGFTPPGHRQGRGADPRTVGAIGRDAFAPTCWPRPDSMTASQSPQNCSTTCAAAWPPGCSFPTRPTPASASSGCQPRRRPGLIPSGPAGRQLAMAASAGPWEGIRQPWSADALASLTRWAMAAWRGQNRSSAQREMKSAAECSSMLTKPSSVRPPSPAASNSGPALPV